MTLPAAPHPTVPSDVGDLTGNGRASRSPFLGAPAGSRRPRSDVRVRAAAASTGSAGPPARRWSSSPGSTPGPMTGRGRRPPCLGTTRAWRAISGPAAALSPRPDPWRARSRAHQAAMFTAAGPFQRSRSRARASCPPGHSHHQGVMPCAVWVAAFGFSGPAGPSGWQVDETGGDDHAAGVHDPLAGEGREPRGHGRDAVAFQPDVGPPRSGPGAVDHAPAADEDRGSRGRGTGGGETGCGDQGQGGRGRLSQALERRRTAGAAALGAAARRPASLCPSAGFRRPSSFRKESRSTFPSRRNWVTSRANSPTTSGRLDASRGYVSVQPPSTTPLTRLTREGLQRRYP